MTGLDLDTIVIDPHAVECSQCYARAVWSFRHLCGMVMYACDRHRLWMDANNPGPGGKGYFTCPKCELPAPQPINWRLIR